MDIDKELSNYLPNDLCCIIFEYCIYDLLIKHVKGRDLTFIRHLVGKYKMLERVIIDEIIIEKEEASDKYNVLNLYVYSVNVNFVIDDFLWLLETYNKIDGDIITHLNIRYDIHCALYNIKCDDSQWSYIYSKLHLYTRRFRKAIIYFLLNSALSDSNEYQIRLLYRGGFLNIRDRFILGIICNNIHVILGKDLKHVNKFLGISFNLTTSPLHYCVFPKFRFDRKLYSNEIGIIGEVLKRRFGMPKIEGIK